MWLSSVSNVRGHQTGQILCQFLPLSASGICHVQVEAIGHIAAPAACHLSNFASNNFTNSPTSSLRKGSHQKRLDDSDDSMIWSCFHEGIKRVEPTFLSRSTSTTSLAAHPPPKSRAQKPQSLLEREFKEFGTEISGTVIRPYGEFLGKQKNQHSNIRKQEISCEPRFRAVPSQFSWSTSCRWNFERLKFVQNFHTYKIQTAFICSSTSLRSSPKKAAAKMENRVLPTKNKWHHLKPIFQNQLPNCLLCAIELPELCKDPLQIQRLRGASAPSARGLVAPRHCGRGRRCGLGLHGLYRPPSEVVK